MAKKQMFGLPESQRWLRLLNGAGDPSQIWRDHAFWKTAAQRPDDDPPRSSFPSGTWRLELELPVDLGDLPDEIDVLAVIVGLADCQKRLEMKLKETVLTARSRGRTWETVGLALGVTRQAAWKRFSPGDG